MSALTAMDPRFPSAGVTAPGRSVLAAFLVLTLVGLGISGELTRIHVLTHTDPSFRAVCAVSEKLDCESVAQSPTSVFAGLPVSLWGALGYLAMAVLAAWGLGRRALHPSWPRGLLALSSLVASAASAVLGYVSLCRVDTICLFCLGTYVVNFGLLVLAVVMLRAAGVGPVTALVADWRSLAARPRLFAGLAIASALAIGTTEISVPAYWIRPGWPELPEMPTGRDASGHFWIGARQPVATIVEFSDYECPHCRRAHREMRLEVSRHLSELRLVHRHMPLDRSCNPAVKRPFHARACEFSRAAECAGEQGSFWDMNDALFSIQDQVDPADVNLDRLAVRIGLDRSTFEECMRSERSLARVRADVEEGARGGVVATPTFFLGDQPYAGVVPRTALERILVRREPGGR